MFGSKKSLTAKQLGGWIQLWPRPEGGQGVRQWEGERKEEREGEEQQGQKKAAAAALCLCVC